MLKAIDPFDDSKSSTHLILINDSGVIGHFYPTAHDQNLISQTFSMIDTLMENKNILLKDNAYELMDHDLFLSKNSSLIYKYMLPHISYKSTFKASLNSKLDSISNFIYVTSLPIDTNYQIYANNENSYDQNREGGYNIISKESIKNGKAIIFDLKKKNLSLTTQPDNGNMDLILNSIERVFLRVRKCPYKKLWSQIVGHENVKKMLERLIFLPLDLSSNAKSLGITSPSGIVLHGSLCNQNNIFIDSIAADQRFCVLNVSATLLFGKNIGDVESNIKFVFESARKVKPCILYIEGIEAIGRKRGSRNSSIDEGGVTERALCSLLSEFDGLERLNQELIVMACVDDITCLDDALLRPGRLSHQIKVDLPRFSDLELIEDVFGKPGSQYAMM